MAEVKKYRVSRANQLQPRQTPLAPWPAKVGMRSKKTRLASKSTGRC